MMLCFAEAYRDADPKKKLDDLIHLAELCIEVLQQNEEYHTDVSIHILLGIVQHQKKKQK
jgi:hypothetical protein